MVKAFGVKQLIVCLVLLALPVAQAISSAPATGPADPSRPPSALKARLRPALPADPNTIASVCVDVAGIVSTEPRTILCRTESTVMR